MFDWFKDVVEELNGIDSSYEKEKKLSKVKKQNTKYYIFSKKIKALIISLGLIYLVMIAITIGIINDFYNYKIFVVKSIALMIIDLITIGCISFGKKKGEIIALIGIIIFVLGQFSMSLI